MVNPMYLVPRPFKQLNRFDILNLFIARVRNGHAYGLTKSKLGTRTRTTGSPAYNDREVPMVLAVINGHL